MAFPQLVGKAIIAETSLSAGTPVSLTTLTGGLATQPAQDDMIIIGLGVTGTNDQTLTITDNSSVPYTDIGSELYANDSADTNQRVAFKFAGSTPDTQALVSSSGSGNAAVITVEVWRDVDPASPLDVLAQQVTGINTGRPDPGAITPSTPDAMIVVIGHSSLGFSSISTFTSSDLSDFRTDVANASFYDIVGGTGHHAWTSGAFDPVQWGGGTTSTNASWAATVFALRPRIRTQNLAPPLLTNTQTFFSPSLAPGAVTIGPPLLVNEQAFFAPALHATNTLQPPLIVNEQTFFPPALALAGMLLPPLLLNEQIFYSPTLAPGPVTIGAPLIQNAQQFFTPTIVPGAVTIAPPLIVNAQQFFAPALSIVIPIATPASRRLNLAVSQIAQRRLAIVPSRAAARRLTLPASRLDQRRLEL